MDDRVTVGADGTQVLDRVDDILTTHLRQGPKVMDVNDPAYAIDSLGIEAADAADGPIPLDASTSSLRIAFICD